MISRKTATEQEVVRGTWFSCANQTCPTNLNLLCYRTASAVRSKHISNDEATLCRLICPRHCVDYYTHVSSHREQSEEVSKSVSAGNGMVAERQRVWFSKCSYSLLTHVFVKREDSAGHMLRSEGSLENQLSSRPMGFGNKTQVFRHRSKPQLQMKCPVQSEFHIYNNFNVIYLNITKFLAQIFYCSVFIIRIF